MSREYIHKKLFSYNDKVHIQFLRYSFVGAMAAVVDMGVFYICSVKIGWHYIIAQTISFTAGITINYLFSILWVFASYRSRHVEMIIFLMIGTGGLLLSYVLLFFLVDVLHFTYLQNMIAKVITIIIVFVWNFTLRKKYAFK